jgi:hypothetical protein
MMSMMMQQTKSTTVDRVVNVSAAELQKMEKWHLLIAIVHS